MNGMNATIKSYARKAHMFAITIETDSDEGVGFSEIRAVGNSELNAVEIFCVLYNAYLMVGPGRKLTNVTDGRAYTSMVSGIESFEELHRYFYGIHQVQLKMEEV
jgi:hypothetical protein